MLYSRLYTYAVDCLPSGRTVVDKPVLKLGRVLQRHVELQNTIVLLCHDDFSTVLHGIGVLGVCGLRIEAVYFVFFVFKFLFTCSIARNSFILITYLYSIVLNKLNTSQ